MSTCILLGFKITPDISYIFYSVFSVLFQSFPRLMLQESLQYFFLSKCRTKNYCKTYRERIEFDRHVKEHYCVNMSEMKSLKIERECAL